MFAGFDFTLKQFVCHLSGKNTFFFIIIRPCFFLSLIAAFSTFKRCFITKRKSVYYVGKYQFVFGKI
jgi:hypothetical protein